MKEIKIENEKSLKGLAEDIVAEILNGNCYLKSKTDIYDRLIYLINKYDENHFFDSTSNAELERMLKISTLKIKNARHNISIKFADDKENDKIFYEFMKKFMEKFDYKQTENKTYAMIIENPVVKHMLEVYLKNNTNDTLDYTLNSEKVVMSESALIAVLEAFGKYTQNNKKYEFEYKTLRQNILNFVKEALSNFNINFNLLNIDIS